MSLATGNLTGRQLRELYRLAKATETDLDQMALRFYGRQLHHLTIKQASGLIENLRLLETMETKS